MARNTEHLIKFPWFYKYRIPKLCCPRNFLSVGILKTTVTADGQGHHMRRKYQLCQGISEIYLTHCLLPGSSHLWVPRENLRTSFSGTSTEYRTLWQNTLSLKCSCLPSPLSFTFCSKYSSNENFSTHSVFGWGTSQMIWFWLEWSCFSSQ